MQASTSYIQSILSNSKSLGDFKDVRITKSSNSRGFLLEIFKGLEDLVGISKSSNYTSFN